MENENDKYKKTIISNKGYEMNLTIEAKEQNLIFNCFCFKDYFKEKYHKEFSLDELKKNLDYYKQFKEPKQIIKEIKNNVNEDKETIDEEDNKNEIILKIPISSSIFKNLEFTLNKVEKKQEEIIEEYKKVIAIYKSKLQISEFASKIVTKTEDKELIKFWI